MLSLNFDIKRDGASLNARVRKAAFFFTFQNLESKEWFWTRFDNLGEYNVFKEKLVRLIFDKPGQYKGLDQVDLVSWEQNVTSQKAHSGNLALYIKRSGLKTGFFTLTITNAKVALYSIELRREELINLMDSITWYLSE